MKPAQAVAYLRVSTEQQAESGLGLEAQRASVTSAAARLGLPLAHVAVDAGVSGALSADDRPALMDAITLLRRHDVLLVAKRDRLGRDVVEVALIERLVQRRGARIVSAAGEGTDSDDASSMLQRRILDAFSEYERLLIGQRTKAALRAKRAKGERVSRFAPFGYALGPDATTLESCAAEQAVLARIRDLRTAGSSLAGIAAALNRAGVRTRSGAPWRFEYVRNVLRARTTDPQKSAAA